jgi:hypothetical protein
MSCHLVRSTIRQTASGANFQIVTYIFKRSNPQDLMLVYNLPSFPAGDLEAFLTSLARANGRVRKVSYLIRNLRYS